jgi:hypothetical protein
MTAHRFQQNPSASTKIAPAPEGRTIVMLKFCASLAFAMTLLVGNGSIPAFAAGGGKAAGTFRLDKTPTALTQAYAVEIVELPEMRVENAPERSIMLILTDRALPDSRRIDDMTAMEQAYRGQLRGLVLDIDPATSKVLSGRTLIPQGELPQFFTVAGDPPPVALEGFVEDKTKGTVAGKVRTRAPMEVMNANGQPGPKTYEFDVAFTTPVIPAPKLTATIESDQARASEQARALKRFLQAVAAKDPNAIRATVVEDHPTLGMLDPAGLDSLKQMIFSDGDSVEDLYAMVTKVYVYEKTATVLLRHPDGWSSYPLALEGGKWKMGF